MERQLYVLLQSRSMSRNISSNFLCAVGLAQTLETRLPYSFLAFTFDAGTFTELIVKVDSLESEFEI